MMQTIPTRSGWLRRVVDATREALAKHRRSTTPLHELDHRTLRDIGVDFSELSSIGAESESRVRSSRLRIVPAVSHG